MPTLHNYKSGFTLVELLVTIAVIGILAAMSMSAFSVYRDSALRVEVESIGRALETGAEALQSAYAEKAGGYFFLSSRYFSPSFISTGATYKKNITDASSTVPLSEIQKFLPIALFNGSRPELMHAVYYGESSNVAVANVGGHKQVNNWAVCNCKISDYPICMVNYNYVTTGGSWSGNSSRRVWMNDSTNYSSGYSLTCPSSYPAP